MKQKEYEHKENQQKMMHVSILAIFCGQWLRSLNAILLHALSTDPMNSIPAE